MSVFELVDELTKEFPDIIFDANHRYRSLEGRSYASELLRWQKNEVCTEEVTIGMLDTHVDASHALFNSARLTQLEIMPSGVPQAESIHGSEVAAILVGDSVSSFNGLLPKGHLYSIGIFRQGTKKKDMFTTAAWIAEGLGLLASKDVKVINVSLGGEHNKVLEHVIEKITMEGVIIVAAAGNGGPKGEKVFPAAYSNVLAITAVDAKKRVFRKATSGSYIDFSAPGVDIFIPYQGKRGKYKSGTSYASPFIAAAIAVDRKRRPDLTVDQYKARLVAMSEDLGEGGQDYTFGWGLPNLSSLCSEDSS